MNTDLKQAIEDVAARAEEERREKLSHAECPDCMALLKVKTDAMTGQASLDLLEHRT